MTPLDKMLADLPTGQAPVEAMVRDGRARRHRRRTTALAAVGALAAVAVVAVLQHPQDDRTGPASGRLEVTVRYDVAAGDPAQGFARWDPARARLTYVSREGWSGSCPPVPSATQETGRVDLTLTEPTSDQPDQVCSADARVVTAEIEGITAAPSVLRVTEGGATYAVPVTTRADTVDVLVVLTPAPDQGPYYFEGALTEVTLEPTFAVRTPPDRPAPDRAPWRHRWQDLEPGRYLLTSSSRPCGGSCDSLDPPTDTCTGTLDLTQDVVVRIGVTYGRPCGFTVETTSPTDRAGERSVPLLSSGWVSGAGNGAASGGVLRVDGDCVYVGSESDPERRGYVAWPAGWTAAVDGDGRPLLRDTEGTVVAHDGDTLAFGGGSQRFEASEIGACDDGRPHEVFFIQSRVDVVGR